MKQITQIGATVEEAISLALQKLDIPREQVDVEVLQEGRKGFLGFGSRPAEVRVTVKAIEVEQPQSNVDEVQLPVESVDEQESTNQQNVFVTEIGETQELGKQEEQPEAQQNSTINEATEQINNADLDEEADSNDANPIEEAKAYLVSIAETMDIHDLTIKTDVNGKYVLFNLESEKAAYLIGKRGQTLNALQQLTQLVLNKNSKSFLLAKLDVENYRERRQLALEQLADRMADKAMRTGKTIQLEPMPSSERKIIHNQLANRLDIETYSEGAEPNRYLVIEPVK